MRKFKTGLTSKIIQISTINIQKVPNLHCDYFVTTALCEDGSIWEKVIGWREGGQVDGWGTVSTAEKWYCILEAKWKIYLLSNSLLCFLRLHQQELSQCQLSQCQPILQRIRDLFTTVKKPINNMTLKTTKE